MRFSVRRSAGSAPRAGWLATSVLVASAPVLLTACSGEDVMATIGMPTAKTAPAHGRANAAPRGPVQQGGQAKEFVVTAHQREYLDALAAAGVKPSSDLIALSIGSYVCQARAAKQNDQAVWDFVLPLVRSDVRDGGLTAMAPSPGNVNAVTADYIRIATERLC